MTWAEDGEGWQRLITAGINIIDIKEMCKNLHHIHIEIINLYGNATLMLIFLLGSVDHLRVPWPCLIRDALIGFYGVNYLGMASFITCFHRDGFFSAFFNSHV